MTARGKIVLGTGVVVLGLHVAGAAGALFFLPRGFALDDIHAWSDTWLPAAIAMLMAVAILRFVLSRSSTMPIALGTAAAAGGWIGAVATGVALFPISIGIERAIGPAAIALALVALAWSARVGIAASFTAFVLGGGVGVAIVFGQRAPSPSTHPAGGTLAVARGDATKDDASSGQIVFPCGKEHVRIRPLLTFESRSPDRTWTALAPADAFGPRRRFDAFTKDKNGFHAHYTDDGETTLVATRDAKGNLDVEAVSKLDAPVYSHLNAFTTIHVPFEATIAFGPTAEERFPLEPADYPRGRPAHFAYLGADLVFRVVRAADAEKGPFTELARGKLGRDDALVVEIRPKEGPGGCRLRFADWSAQASTEPSPTAGWGVTQSSVQFSRQGDAGFVVLALAETGPGRGFHSVGHAAGTYANHLQVEPLPTAAPSGRGKP